MDNTAIDMSYSKMKEYLGEWYYDAQFSTIQKPAGYDTAKIFNILKEQHSGEEVFIWMTDIGAPLTEETIVSTAGIVGDELRGLIEQCFNLDKQMAEDTMQKIAEQNKQKGE